MPKRKLTTTPVAEPSADALAARLVAIRAELDISETFPPEVLVEAEQAARRPLADRPDMRTTPFFTLDPPGSLDLDQAMFLERSGTGYVVRYAIADVPAVVDPDGAVDAEARRRGVTIYAPDRRIPLHPPVLAEDAASLLPGRDRPAYVWTLTLDSLGVVVDVDLVRATIRSRARRDYPEVERLVAAGASDDQVSLLREIGTLRLARERDRGGASLPMPSQEVVREPDGRSRLVTRPAVASEDWNAQISLMTGMAAAEIMLDAGVGVLRTMPAPDERDVQRLRLRASSMSVAWPEDLPYGAFLRTLDAANPRHLALIYESAGLFRGAGYTAFDGAPPAASTHAAIAAPYAHVTAPLRRLVDRFGLVACAAITGGAPVPEWVRRALPLLPETMAAADRRASAVERASIDAVEAAVLSGRVGSTVRAIVVDSRPGHDPTVQIDDLAIVARASGRATEGSVVDVVVHAADVSTGTADLRIATPASA